MRYNVQYAGNTWTFTGPKLVLRELRSLQAALKTALPPDYVAFLKAVNGGIPSKPFFRLHDPAHEWDWVTGMFACSEKLARTILSIQAMATRLPGLIDEGSIPIGTCASDGFLALRLARTRHHVWFYSVHEDRVIDLAPSFSSLLARLKESAPEDAFQL